MLVIYRYTEPYEERNADNIDHFEFRIYTTIKGNYLSWTSILNSDDKYTYKGLYITFRIDTLVIAKSDVKKDGSFKISVTTDREFDVYYRYQVGEDCFLQTIKPTDKDRIKLNLVFPNIYKKENNEVICPKCIKHDQKIPILYQSQFGRQYFEVIDSIGNKIVVPFNDTNYYEGCTFSRYDPKYFFKGDKIKF